jgi:hypothetical protein
VVVVVVAAATAAQVDVASADELIAQAELEHQQATGALAEIEGMPLTAFVLRLLCR